MATGSRPQPGGLPTGNPVPNGILARIYSLEHLAVALRARYPLIPVTAIPAMK
jgi:hypothetical protein